MSSYRVARSVTHNFSRRLNPIAYNFLRAPRPERILFDKSKRPGFYEDGVASRLPPAFFKYRIQAKQTAPNYHYVQPESDWKLNEVTGERQRTDRLPIRMYYPTESQFGLWGGEGYIRGYKKSNKGRNVRYHKLWRPPLFKYDLHSEILDRSFRIQVTPKTLDLIDDAFGFDFYILKTPAHEMRSLLGMKLKRHMLLALARKDTLYPDDPEKRAKILRRYADYIVPEEEAEWCGLTRSEALEKQRRIEAIANPIRPLLDVYTEQLIDKLKAANIEDGEFDLDTEEIKKKSRPILQRIFGESSPVEDDKTKS